MTPLLCLHLERFPVAPTKNAETWMWHFIFQQGSNWQTSGGHLCCCCCWLALFQPVLGAGAQFGAGHTLQTDQWIGHLVPTYPQSNMIQSGNYNFVPNKLLLVKIFFTFQQVWGRKGGGDDGRLTTLAGEMILGQRGCAGLSHTYIPLYATVQMNETRHPEAGWSSPDNNHHSNQLQLPSLPQQLCVV